MRDFDEVTRRVFALYDAHGYREGLRASIEADRLFPKMRNRTLFWIACFYSLVGDSEEAIRTLRGAVARGYFWHESTLLNENDLRPLRGDARFKEVVSRSNELWKRAQRNSKPRLKVFVPRRGEKFPLMVTLHGRGGNAVDHAKRWASLTRVGVACAIPQSSQVAQKGLFCWDDELTANKEVGAALVKVSRSYPIDSKKVLLGGTSQGGALAVKMALEQKLLKIKGFVVVVPAVRDVGPLVELIPRAAAGGLRGYFFTGERDSSRPKIEELYHEMEARRLPCRLDVQQGLGHEYPKNFAPKLASAVRFVLSSS